MEPWQLLLHYDANDSAIMRGGVLSGHWIKISGTHQTAHITLAYAAINSLLEAFREWKEQAGKHSTMCCGKY